MAGDSVQSVMLAAIVQVMPINESRALVTLLSSGASPTDLLLHVAVLNQGGETVSIDECLARA